ncbi:TerD family protein [Heliorestis acidaminivorans]|uniref:TerD family protein n=1 Tax=Heliorestis acidaminivorans TaxID=553427 RepID=A0A6I0ETV5_9FIRM|nr:TerD family protein [Heliorestis acidaminivorans]KAB2952600.1 TerD family protein [Heliorestis acidaminivorans]
MGISLSKGQKVDLTKGNASLKKIGIGLGWDTNKYDGQHDFDLDASVFLVSPSGKVENDKNFIFYNNLQDPSGAVVHSGDNRTGDGDGDDEYVSIELDKVPENVAKIAFTVTIHDAPERSQNFGQVSNAYIRVIDEATNNELMRFDLGEDFSVETAVVAGELYRHQGEWKFNAIGSGFQGGLGALCNNYGLSV